MKSIFAIIVLFSSSMALGDGLITGCLGFPSALNFTCTVEDGASYEIDLPAGSGCNLAPESGTINGHITIYKPRASFGGEQAGQVSFYLSELNEVAVELVCSEVHF